LNSYIHNNSFLDNIENGSVNYDNFTLYESIVSRLSKEDILDNNKDVINTFFNDITYNNDLISTPVLNNNYLIITPD